jgi:hypothetical protein
MLDHEEFCLVDFLFPVTWRQLEQWRHALGIKVGILLLWVVLERHLLRTPKEGSAGKKRQRQEAHRG